jgi:hypothetical protein
MSRKFRWMFEATFPSGNIKPRMVKVDTRPNIEYASLNPTKSEPQVLQPVEGKWEAIKTTFFDVGSTSEEDKDFFKIFAVLYEQTNQDGTLKEGAEKLFGEAKLSLLCPKYSYDMPPPQTKVEGEQKSSVRPMGIGALGISYMGRTQTGWDTIEEWTLKKMWPTAINFGYLDCTSSDTGEVEVTWRYAEVEYKNMYPTPIPIA